MTPSEETRLREELAEARRDAAQARAANMENSLALAEARGALWKATVRLTILRDRAEGCDALTDEQRREQHGHELTLFEVPAWIKEQSDIIERLDAALARAGEQETPVPVVLHCPSCGMQHVDKPEPETGWTNPPHRSHKCHGCGVIWRPADVPTNGITAPNTRGSADTWDVFDPPDEAQREATLWNRSLIEKGSVNSPTPIPEKQLSGSAEPASSGQEVPMVNVCNDPNCGLHALHAKPTPPPGEQGKGGGEGLRKALSMTLDALIWASGSDHFGPGGKAHGGWVKLGRPAIRAAIDALGLGTLAPAQPAEHPASGGEE